MPTNWMANLGSAGRAQGGTPVLPGSPPYNYDPRFGGIPGVPSPGQTQQTAIGSNISALGPLYNLGAPLNQFTAQQAPTSLNLNLPNYQQNLATQSQDVMSKLKGQIPQDVLNQLQQVGAERGVGTGSIGSPNSDAATLRALGLTSLDIQNQGMQQFGKQIAQTPQGAQFNPFNFLITPEQQQQAQYQANLLNAAPVPSSAQYAGLNAFQQGRGQGFSGFPSSAPSSSPYVSPYSSGQRPLGGGGSATPSSYSNWQAGMPSPVGWSAPPSVPFNYETGTPPGWQTGMPLEGYGGPTWGGGPYPQTPSADSGIPYNPSQSPVSTPWNDLWGGGQGGQWSSDFQTGFPLSESPGYGSDFFGGEDFFG